MKNFKNITKTLKMAAAMVAVFLLAAMTIYAVSDVTLTTDSIGEAKAEDLALGNYSVTISKDGYYSKEVSTSIVADEGLNNVVLDVELDEITEANTEITVNIKDGSGNPIQDATATIGGVQKSTNPSGTATYNGLTFGEHTITAYKDGYYTATANTTLVKLEGQEKVAVDVTLTAITEGTATVTILDGSGTPVANATVTINGTNVTTDGNGVAVFNLAVGNYDIAVSKTGYYSTTGSITIVAIEGQDNPTTTINVTEVTSGSLKVIVTDSGGNPIVGAMVEIKQ